MSYFNFIKFLKTRVKYNSGAREKLENRKKEFEIQNNWEKGTDRRESIEKSIPIYSEQILVS